MKNGLKKIILIIMISWTVCYMKGCVSLNDKGRQVSGNASPELLLVNEKHVLGKDYEPSNLTIPNIGFSDGASPEEKHIAGVIVKPLEELVRKAKDEGIILLGNSGYRSYNSQEETFDNRIKEKGKKLAVAYVAKPGSSEHQTGLCIDITNKDKYFVNGTKEANWLAKNCYKFGFIIRYPAGKKNITGIEYEPWHIRYVGKTAAKYIYDNKITLEEYLGK